MQTRRTNASAYCDYNETFQFYDQLREPNGCRELLEIFQRNGKPLREQIVLEGGFGTGAYIQKLKQQVQAIYGVEGSEQGYETTLRKIGAADNVHLEMGNILNLDFSDHFFDAYMVNQVVHHLDNDPAYPNLNRFLQEAFRVLKPGCVLSINTSTREQLDPQTGVFWSYSYISRAAQEIAKRFIPIEALVSRLEAEGFVHISQTIPADRLFQDRYYSDPEVVMDPEFWKVDSVYCFCSQDELRKLCHQVAQDIETKSIYSLMNRARARGEKIGESVILSAQKPRT